MSLLMDATQDFKLRDYVLQTLQPIERLREEYPNLIFEELSNQLIRVQVPIGAEDELRRLQDGSNVLTIPTLYGLNAIEAISESNIAMFHQYPFGGLRGQGVIIGFVDTGIDYTSNLFKNQDNTTRILRIWDQTIEGNPPQGYTYGTQYTNTEMDIALRSENPFEIVPTRDEIGHGTFLAGVAAGDDRIGDTNFVGGAPDAAIVMVKLRQAKQEFKEFYLIRDTDIAFQGNDVVTGLDYLLQTSIELRMPLVICIGLGNNYGAHNGSSIIERYLNSLSILQSLIVVVAGGNEANSGHHFRSTIAQGGIEDIEINVSEEEVRGFFTYLWADISDKVAVSIRSPIGQAIDRVPVISNSLKSFSFSLEQTVVTINYNYPDAQTGAENVNIRFKSPTPGIWTITVYGEEIVDGTYDVWLQRNDFVIETTRFLKPDTLITITIPSTAEYVITVGAYDYIDQSVYVGSGRGPMADGRIKPDLIAPGVNVMGPKPGGGYTTYVGTSTAAAVTASAAVLLMQWAILQGNLPEMNTRIARNILIRGAVRRRGAIYPNPIEGYGRLDLRTAISSI
jgi:subtilisin family serine protease